MRTKEAVCMCGHPYTSHDDGRRCSHFGDEPRDCQCKTFTDKLISRRRSASRQAREAGPKAEILKLLESKGIRHFRMQSGDIVVQVGARRRRIVGNKPGTPDILCLMKDRFDECWAVWIEVKAGTKQRPEQAEFQKEAEARGETYLLARSAQDVENFLKDQV